MEKLLELLGMSKAKPVKTPFTHRFLLFSEQSQWTIPKSEEEKKMMDQVPHGSLVGRLIFAMLCTRPDIAF